MLILTRWIILFILNINNITSWLDVISYLTHVKPKDISHDVPNPQTTSVMWEKGLLQNTRWDSQVMWTWRFWTRFGNISNSLENEVPSGWTPYQGFVLLTIAEDP